MAWQTIAQASTIEELEQVKPAVADIPAGSPILITISLQKWMPVAYIANFPSMEFWAQKFYREVKVTDVRATDAWTVEIHGIAIGTSPLIIIAIVAGVLSVVGITWAIASISIQADITQQAEVQAKAEQARIAFIEKYEPIYGDAVSGWLAGVTAPTASQQAESSSLMDDLKKAIVPAISIGAVVVIAILVLFGLQYVPKSKRSTA